MIKLFSDQRGLLVNINLSLKHQRCVSNDATYRKLNQGEDFEAKTALSGAYSSGMLNQIITAGPHTVLHYASSHVNIQFRAGDFPLVFDFGLTSISLSRSFLSSMPVSSILFSSRSFRVCSKRITWFCSGIH